MGPKQGIRLIQYTCIIYLIIQKIYGRNQKSFNIHI